MKMNGTKAQRVKKLIIRSERPSEVTKVASSRQAGTDCMEKGTRTERLAKSTTVMRSGDTCSFALFALFRLILYDQHCCTCVEIYIALLSRG